MYSHDHHRYGGSAANRFNKNVCRTIMGWLVLHVWMHKLDSIRYASSSWYCNLSTSAVGSMVV